jgi:hypothetical protein
MCEKAHMKVMMSMSLDDQDEVFGKNESLASDKKGSPSPAGMGDGPHSKCIKN